MDRSDDQIHRGRARERIYLADPEFAELLVGNDAMFSEVETEMPYQHTPKKFKKTKTGCMPNLRISQIASIIFHHNFKK